MSTLRVDNIKSRTGTVVTVPEANTLAVTGIVSVTSAGNITNGGTFTNSGSSTFTGPAEFGSGANITGNISVTGDAAVTGGLSVTGEANLNTTGIITCGTLNVSGSTTFGQITGTIADLTVTNDATIGGNLTVNGTTTTIDTANLSVEDANIGIGSVTTPTNTTANGGGLTLFGGADGDKEFKWIDSSAGPDYWNLTGGFLYAGEGLSTRKMLKEQVNIVASSVYNTGVVNLQDGMIHHFTTAQNGVSARVNIRYSPTVTLNDAMNVGESITVTLITAVNSSSNYVANINIDGANQSPSFIGGTAWTDGGSSGVDIYTFHIIKTAANTYTTIANQTKTS